MDAHQAIPLGVLAVNTVHRVHHLGDGVAGEFVAEGAPGSIEYVGKKPVREFRSFEILLHLRTEKGGRGSFLFRTKTSDAYEVRICNAPQGDARPCDRLRTGTLVGRGCVWSRCVNDGEWFELRITVTGKRIRIRVGPYPVVDYVSSGRKGRESPALNIEGAFALRWSGGPGSLRVRKILLRPIAASETQEDSYAGKPYGLEAETIEEFARSCFPFLDYHVHLRGGMTVEKALLRQAETEIGIGVLRNIGRTWPIETDEQLREFLDSVEGKPLFVGLQVNDRDWFKKHDRKLLRRLDYVLADTMIMPMPTDRDEPVKLWQADKYRIKDPEAWMGRYLRHNLRVLSEPVSILANPTYLPPAVSDRYDELWTEARMRTVIEAAVKNHVALEINARSGLPHERFIRLAKKLGAKFTFGTNNFTDRPISLKRCVEAVRRYGLTPADMFLPGRNKLR